MSLKCILQGQKPSKEIFYVNRDTTFNEVVAAAADGKEVCYLEKTYYSDAELTTIKNYPLICISDDDQCVFVGPEPYNADGTIETRILSSDNTWSIGLFSGPSDTTPLANGTASIGTSQRYARADHVHPRDDTKLDKSGGTMTGSLVLKGDPAEDLEAATKQYIDNQVSIPEDLANSLELGTNPTVADALAALAERNTNYEDLIAGQLQIMTSQYEGAGTYGASNPMSLEIPGKPLAIWISPTGQDPRQDIWGLRGTTQLHYGVNTYNPLVTWGDESISWYSTSNATYQGNVSSIVYNVLVIYEPKTFDGPVKLTVLDSRGDPCVGCVVTGVYSKAGIKCRTNAQGVASGYGTSGQECTIQSAYIDLKDKNFTMPTISATGIEISETLEDTPTTEVVIVNTSQIVRMSRDRKADVAVVGGGTGGRGGNGATASGNGLPDGMYGSGGSGGAGGKVLNLSDFTIASGAYSLVIGAGGSGGYGGSGTTVSSSASTSGTAGTAGGDTTWGAYSSANGTVSGVPLSDSAVIAGGPGGSGGGGGATTASITTSTTRKSGSAGTRAGGKGGDGGRGGRGGDAGLTGSKGGPGGGGGGGGGGGSGMYYDEYGRGGNGGAGGPGCLVIRFKE